MTCAYHPTIPATHRFVGGTTRLCSQCAEDQYNTHDAWWAVFIVPVEEAA